MTRDARYEGAAENHRAAVRSFVELTEGLGEARWHAPWAEGKWTVAELSEHLVLTYEVSLQELRGSSGPAPRVKPLMATVLRTVLLPHILFHGSIPVRARAPREIRPAARNVSRSQMLQLLNDLSAAFLTELRHAHADRSRKLHHPYFGPIRPLQLLRFATVHLDHHRRQLKSLADPRAPR